MNIMKKILIPCTLFLLVVVGCELLGLDEAREEVSKSYMTFSINEKTFDSRLNKQPRSKVFAGVMTFQNKDILQFSYVDFDTLLFPYNVSVSFKLYYDSLALYTHTQDSVTRNFVKLPILTVFESSGDAGIETYTPFNHEENELSVQLVDTLNATYLKGHFTSWITVRHTGGAPFNTITEPMRQLPDLFKIEQSEFFIELKDNRER